MAKLVQVLPDDFLEKIEEEKQQPDTKLPKRKEEVLDIKTKNEDLWEEIAVSYKDNIKTITEIIPTPHGAVMKVTTKAKGHAPQVSICFVPHSRWKGDPVRPSNEY